jgi:hypothetical protein
LVAHELVTKVKLILYYNYSQLARYFNGYVAS